MRLFVLATLGAASSLDCPKKSLSALQQRPQFLGDGKMVYESWNTLDEAEDFVRALGDLAGKSPHFLSRYECVEDGGRFHLVTDLHYRFLGRSGAAKLEPATTRAVIEALLDLTEKFPAKFPSQTADEPAVFIEARSGLARFDPRLLDGADELDCSGESGGQAWTGRQCALAELLTSKSKSKNAFESLVSRETLKFLKNPRAGSDLQLLRDFLTQLLPKVEAPARRFHERLGPRSGPDALAKAAQRTLFMSLAESDQQLLISAGPRSYVVEKPRAGVVSGFVCLADGCADLRELADAEVHLAPPPAGLAHTLTVKRQLLKRYSWVEEVFYFVVYAAEKELVAAGGKQVHVLANAGAFAGLCRSAAGGFAVQKKPDLPPAQTELAAAGLRLDQVTVDGDVFPDMRIVPDFSPDAPAGDCAGFDADLRAAAPAGPDLFQYLAREGDGAALSSVNLRFNVHAPGLLPLVRQPPFPQLRLDVDKDTPLLLARQEAGGPEQRLAEFFRRLRVVGAGGELSPQLLAWQGGQWPVFDLAASPQAALLSFEPEDSGVADLGLRLVEFPLTPFGVYQKQAPCFPGLYFMLQRQDQQVSLTFFFCQVFWSKKFCTVLAERTVPADNRRFAVAVAFGDFRLATTVQETRDYFFLGQTGGAMIRGLQLSRVNMDYYDSCFSAGPVAGEAAGVSFLFDSCRSERHPGLSKFTASPDFCAQARNDFTALACDKRLVLV